MRIPTGEVPYHEACALVQDWLADRWAALAHIRPDAQKRATQAKAAARKLRAAGGTATCVMKI